MNLKKTNFEWSSKHFSDKIVLFDLIIYSSIKVSRYVSTKGIRSATTLVRLIAPKYAPKYICSVAIFFKYIYLHFAKYREIFERNLRG